MSVVRPEFLKVSPADIGRVGFDGAAILALVRYVTGLPGENNGRRTVDGGQWWRATHDDIGQALGGVHRKTVRRALLKLESAGELLAIPAKTFHGDRAQAYRVPDQPLDGNGQGSDQPLDGNGQAIGRKWPTPLAGSGPPPWPEVANLPIPEELEEKGRRPSAASDEPDPAEQHQSSNDPPPQNPSEPNGDSGAVVPSWWLGPDGRPRCRAHQNRLEDTPCHACGEARKAFQENQLHEAATEAQRRADITRAIDNCRDCDPYGRLDDLTDCPKHPNHRPVAS